METDAERTLESIEAVLTKIAARAEEQASNPGDLPRNLVYRRNGYRDGIEEALKLVRDARASS